MSSYRQLPEEERIRQIGDLLATAALRYLDVQPNASPPGQSKVPVTTMTHVWDLVDDEVEKQILRYLLRHFAAVPADMERALSLSGMTLTRRLARLREVGLVTVSGKTRNALYRLASEALRN